MKRIRILSPEEILLTEFICPNNLSVYRVATLLKQLLWLGETAGNLVTDAQVNRAIPGQIGSLDNQTLTVTQEDSS
jgi:hypothetical protein